ncbi:MAG: DNA methyltransferase [Microscillaceae bacterium]|nr:DNA methyltransferase [Microscillaceae bacterium]MDW8461329.1 DNA methyltransferase [Cytophagales bacterium]
MTEERVTKEALFGQMDFKTLAENPDFKEDSVREVLILPILQKLGYKPENIVRSKTLKHPFLTIGSNQKREIKLVPDYLLKVEGSYAWVLDAKSPKQKVNDKRHVEQVYSYASHPEIRSIYFALCNGIEFALYRREQTNTPILYFSLDEIEYHWEKLKMFLSPSSFQAGKSISYENTSTLKQETFDYATRPLLEEIPVKKQAAKRHFGVHGYFTKQTWNVVAEYIKNFSKPGDLVLDPFGGSGVTAIEAMMNNRKAISIDLNPLAVFLVQSLIAPVKESELAEAFEQVKTQYQKLEPKTEVEIQKALKKYPKPKPLPLPKGSDVPTVRELFSDKQVAQLGLLKFLIKKQKNENIRKSLMLMFSGVVTRINLTYHISKSVKAKTGFGGDAAAFRYYRYRIAPYHTEVDIMKCFELRYKKVLAAKKEIEYFINEQTISDIQILKGTATDLKFLPRESVDYIYTDPPYGKKIPYLDLSAMWNAWLDLDVSEKDYELEAIEGGSHEKSKQEYNQLIAKSIQEMYRVLKFDRWLSFVFAHKDPEFWHLIIETAESCGFEYVGAVPQKNGQTSFKKRQHPFTVLSGQLIINFRKVRNPRAIMKANLGMDIAQIVMQTIEGIIAKYNGASLEQINDELIIKGLELGFLDLLKKQYSDLTPILLDNFDYDEKTELFTLRKNARFKTNIDVKLRIKYYLISYLRRMERANYYPTFDEITLNILPLLKNGLTPENQTILSVLQDIAERIGQDRWKLRQEGQTKLF